MAIGDAVGFIDSNYSQLLELSPSNMYILFIDDCVIDILTTNISVSLDKVIYGFILDIYYAINLMIAEEDINIESIIVDTRILVSRTDIFN